ncbi:hypothetical protein CR513_53415, partial [Mucuna pruriens]
MLSHIEGGGPPRDNPRFEVWDDKDSLVMTWLWNSMTLEIILNYMFYSFVREIWNNLIETYSMTKDFTACYDIESRILNCRQGTLLVIEYYETLKSEETQQPVMLDKRRSNKGSAMARRSFPLCLRYFLLREMKRTNDQSCLIKKSSNTGSAMVIGKDSTKGSTSKGKPFTKSSRRKYYKRLGHTKDIYYKLYGKKKVLERIGGNKGPTHMWVNQMTPNKESVVEHPSTLKLD